jgi:prepilin-type N-terminal cleavage/methylation domain-containing protein
LAATNEKEPVTTSVTKTANSKGFSLFELLIVLVVISVLYGVAVAFVTVKESSDEGLRFHDIKKYILKHYPHERVVLKVFKDGKTALYRAGSEIKKLEKLFDAEEIRVYQEDEKGFFEKSFESLHDGKKRREVVLIYTVDRDGKSDTILVEDQERFILLRGFSSEAMVFDSLSSVEEYIAQLKGEIDAL